MHKILFALGFAMLAFPAFGQVTDSTEHKADTGYYNTDSTHIDSLVSDEEPPYERAGEELMNEEVEYDFSSNYGPNQKNFMQGFTYYGFVVGPSDTGVTLNYGLSYNGIVGWRYKRKLSGLFALVGDMGFGLGDFNISQPHKNYFLDTTFWGVNDISHRKEKVGYYAIDLSGYLRINFDPKRGNWLGRYIDLGANGSYIFASKYVAVDDRKDARLKSRFTRFPYVSPLQYDLTAKLGTNILAVVVKYRMSDFFRGQYRFPEFARFSIGLELSSLE
jgi:hypothetical protein